MSQTLAVANGDLDINAVGSVDLISGRDKVSQDIAEILLSEYDASRDYGGKLQTMVVPGTGAKALIANELQRILKRLQISQASDPGISAAEKIISVKDVKVSQVNDTDYTFSVTIQTADNGSLVLTDSVKYRPVQIAHTWPSGMFPATINK